MKSLVDTQKLKQLREINGWSQTQLSEMAVTSLRTIQRMEKDGNCSIETVKSVAAVFDIDFKELLVKADKQEAVNVEGGNKSFFYEFQKVWFKSKPIFWTINFSIALLSGLFFSIFISDDSEKLIIISISVASEIILWSLSGGYKTAKNKFMKKYGNVFEET